MRHLLEINIKRDAAIWATSYGLIVIRLLQLNSMRDTFFKDDNKISRVKSSLWADWYVQHLLRVIMHFTRFQYPILSQAPSSWSRMEAIETNRLIFQKLNV